MNDSPDIRLAPVRAFLSSRLGMAFDGPRAAAIEDVLWREVHRVTGGDAAAYLRRLADDPAVLQTLVSRITIGETHFFREAGHFQLLRERVLPQLVAGRPPSRRLHLWSAGCATGEEAYSLAMTLDDAGLLHDADVLGTDVDPAAIHRARQGHYRDWSLRGVDRATRTARFELRDGEMAVPAQLRDAVRFEVHNLVTDRPPAPAGGFDVIFCRNVLIYLTPDAVAEVLGRLAEALAPGGYLVTASTDPRPLGTVDLELVVTGEGSAYRRRDVSAGVPDLVQVTVGPRKPWRPRDRGTRRRHVASPPAGPRPERRGAAAAASSAPLDATVHHRRALSLLAEERWDEAVQAATAALFLEPAMPAAEIALGRAALGRGDRHTASRAFRNARSLLARLEPDDVVPTTDSTAARLLAELDRITVV